MSLRYSGGSTTHCQICRGRRARVRSSSGRATRCSCVSNACQVPPCRTIQPPPFDARCGSRPRDRLLEGLVRYVDTFGEPYWDFIFRNMFYDEDEHLVTFLDFGFPPLFLPILDELERRSPIEVSLAALVASAIFDAGRPKRMGRLREHHHACSSSQP